MSDFSLGEPDFDTPEHICRRRHVEAMAKGHTHYTPAAGTAELKAAIARVVRPHLRPGVKAENVIVSNGAKHSIHTALAADRRAGRRSHHPHAVLGELLGPREP